MFGSAILDVTIGLILLYLLFSLVCSAFRELVELITKTRAKDLEREADLVQRFGFCQLVGRKGVGQLGFRLGWRGLRLGLRWSSL